MLPIEPAEYPADPRREGQRAPRDLPMRRRFGRRKEPAHRWCYAPAGMQVSRRISVREVMSRIHHEDWELSEDQVPESMGHDRVSDRLKHLLIAWAERAGHTAQIGRNLAVRWDEIHPSI